MGKRNRRLLPSLSFPVKITLTIIAVVLLAALLISIAAYRAASQSIRSLESDILKRSADSVSERTYNYFSSFNDCITELIRQPLLINLRNNKIAADEFKGVTGELDLLLESIIHSYTSASANGLGLQFISFYFNNGITYSTLTRDDMACNSFSEWEVYLSKYISDSINTTAWFGTQSLYAYNNNMVQSCLFSKYLYDSHGVRVGLIIVGVAESSISQLYNTVFPDGYIMLKDGCILSAAESSLIGSPVNSKELLDVFSSNKYSQGELTYNNQNSQQNAIYRILPGNSACLFLPVSTPFGLESINMYTFTIKTMIITFCVLIISTFLARFFSHELTKSIISLKKVVQQVYDGDLKSRFKSNGSDEIAYLGLKINDMLEQVEDSFIKQEQDAAEKRNLELRLLQAQINPHLIYNTLNSTIWALRNNNTPKAEQLIFLLSDFFRLSLSNGMELVPLRIEIELINNYVTLQGLMKHADYKLQIEINPMYLDCPILCMTLQPLVENSIRHGFYEMSSGTMIISCDLSDNGNDLLLKVYDNGVGIPPKMIADLDALFEAQTSNESDQNHYGLYNINRRIQNKYGSRYGLSIASELDEYTECTMILPYLPCNNGGLP